MLYNWDLFFTGQSPGPKPYTARDDDMRDGEQLPRSQSANVTEDYLVDEDPVLITPEMLEMAWDNEQRDKIGAKELKEEKREL